MLPISPDLVGQVTASVLKQMQAGNFVTKAGGSPVGPYVHGPGGLFGVRGLERDIISTHTNITGSLADVIPFSPSIDMVPLFPYITGFIRSDTQEKNGVCDDPEEAGPFKTCIQTTVFGRKEFKTRELEINRIGQRLNWAERTDDMRVVNSPLVSQMGGLLRALNPNLTDSQAAVGGNEVVMRFMEVAVAYQRWFCPQIFTGNPANSSAGGGYKEFTGLDLLIAKNKVDALTGQACPSLYSDVKDFGYREVDSTADPDIVKTLTTMMRILKRRASTQNMGAVDWRIVMREPLFYALTEIWPCRYITYRCSNIDGANIDPVGSFSVEAMVRMKNEMRDGQYLLIDNVKYPVILDDCIMEDNQSVNGAIPIGGFASDIYIIPFSVMGGAFRTFYMEYFDYASQNSLPSVLGQNGPRFWWSDNGIFLWTMLLPKVWCVDWAVKVEPRLILRTPQLAGRLTNVVYVPLQHTPDPLPSQSYFVNGGVVTGRPAPSPFSEWNLAGPGFNN